MQNSQHRVAVVGAGLAGSEASLQLAKRGINVTLFEMRPQVNTPVHKSENFAELVCSNSLKSTKVSSAAGMLKHELDVLGSELYKVALDTKVEAGGALAVDREQFSQLVTDLIHGCNFIEVVNEEVDNLEMFSSFDAVIFATGPMTSEKLANVLGEAIGEDFLHFYDAAAPIVMADSLDYDVLFSQNRYEGKESDAGDYLNAPFTREEYEAFITELVNAQRVVLKEFETKELFQACQPIEEIAKKGTDAPRFGALKPVGLTDPRCGKRPWAVVQLRAENKEKTAFNLVGFQTNLTFPEQKRVFSMIPGLENAEFARYGVMHKNIFLNAPKLLDANLSCAMLTEIVGTPVYVAGQLSGTEGYVEAIRSGLHAAISVTAQLNGVETPTLPAESTFGSLVAYATNSETVDYQPMHVNFGIMKPLPEHIKNKQKRYEAYAERGSAAIEKYALELSEKADFKSN